MIKEMDSDHYRILACPVNRQVNSKNRQALVWERKQGKEKLNVTHDAIIRQNTVRSCIRVTEGCRFKGDI